MADDDLLPNPPGAPASPRKNQIVCEFCESRLSQEGEVLRMGDAARSFRTTAEKLEKASAEVERLKTENAALREQLTARPAPAAARDDDDDDA